MTATRTVTIAGDLVPLADRLRYLQWFRGVVAVVVIVCALAAGDDLAVPAGTAIAATGGYVALTFAALAFWRLSGSRGTHMFGAVLMVDGVFLAAAAYATGGAGSPVRYLIVLHLIAVALLASYRTGMKLAMWHSLLLLVVFYAQQAEILRPLAEDVDLGLGTPFQQLLMFSGLFWLVAIITASFSAVNERELRRRRFDLEALAVMARRLEEASGSADAADVLLDSVADAFGIDRAVVLASSEGDRLEVLAHRGDVRGGGAAIVPRPDSIARRAMAEGGTLLTAALRQDCDAELRAVLPDARNVVVVPMSAGRRGLGVLIAEHPLRAGSRIERRVVGMLERFAAHAALALRNAWLLEEIQHLAATDALTGLANRATFQRTLAAELARARREEAPVSLVLLDIDRFKALNDTHGHLAGDEVLRGVSAALDACCRASDTPVRYGGEEFAVILPQTDRETAFAIAERLRHAIAHAALELPVTVSAGVATFPRDGADGDGLVNAADEALYASKRGGRDRVTAA